MRPARFGMPMQVARPRPGMQVNAAHDGEFRSDPEFEYQGVSAGIWDQRVLLPPLSHSRTEDVGSRKPEDRADTPAFAKTVVRTENLKLPWWQKMFRKSGARTGNSEDHDDRFLAF